MVDALLDHDEVRAISFVGCGSTQLAQLLEIVPASRQAPAGELGLPTHHLR